MSDQNATIEQPVVSNAKEQQKERLRAGLKAMFASQKSEASEKHSDDDSGEEDKQIPVPATDGRNTIAEDVVRIDTKSAVIEINNIRLFSLAELDLDKLTECKSLSIRKNLVHELIPFPEHLACRLEELDFFDNKIRKIRDFFSTVKGSGEAPMKHNFHTAFAHLTKLDLSYNQIRDIAGLEPLGPTLRELYLVENKIKEVRNLDALVNLELLELGGNRIREIGPGLEKLSKLKQLWLGKNKITAIGVSLHKLHSLEIVSLQANRITRIEPENFLGETANPNLREVYLSENGISTLDHLDHLSTVRIMDFSFNPISVINTEVINPQNMPELEEFWLTDGRIESWDEVEKLSSFKHTLKTVYLERNPIEEDKRYRDKVYMFLPFLIQIDSWPIVNKGDLEADRKRRA